MKKVFDKLYKMRLVASNREAEEALEVKMKQRTIWESSNQQSYEQWKRDGIDACIAILLDYLTEKKV